MSKTTLLASAATIKAETSPRANTATRVGTMFEDIINEAVPYKVYKALLSQNAPSGAKNANTAVAVMVLGQLWTVATVGSADFSNQELISGTMNVDGMVIRIIDDGGFTSVSFDSSLSYDGSPYLVSTDVNGDFNPSVNSLGGIPTFSYSSAGNYNVNLVGAFIKEKTFLKIFKRSTDDDVIIYVKDINTVRISNSTSATPSDDLLNYTPIEIEIYP